MPLSPRIENDSAISAGNGTVRVDCQSEQAAIGGNIACGDVVHGGGVEPFLQPESGTGCGIL